MLHHAKASPAFYHKMQKRIRQVFTSMREHACVSYAKVATIGGVCDIDLTIVKATSPDDLPLLDKYVHEFLKIFSLSPTSYRAFALSFTHRFSKTKSWRVALKCLVLVHRLLHSLPKDGPLRAELLWSRTNGFLSLYPCNFRDFSSSASEDYTLFVRSYARLLDEILDCAPVETTTEKQIPCLDNDIFTSKIAREMPTEEDLHYKMKELGRKIEILPQLQSLIDRTINCWPIGAAATNVIVKSAMRFVIRDSFTFYNTFKTEVVMVLDNLIQLPYHSCLSSFDIYKKAAIQADQLSEFHDTCKSLGYYCGSYGYPFIDLIPKIQVQALETFLNEMWQLSDQYSSSSNISTVVSSNVQSPLGSTEDDVDSRGVRQEVKVDQEKKDAEMEPLIQWEVDSNSPDWEDLLDSSISTRCMNPNNHLEHNPLGTLQDQNLFYHHVHWTQFYHGSCPSNPVHLLDV